uniref:non-specific serine/threonine protein kinase n=1 Tax=Heterorhabditis bacteriophora TaxID=37862 RepID=A0A1I7X0N4_HETBA
MSFYDLSSSSSPCDTLIPPSPIVANSMVPNAQQNTNLPDAKNIKNVILTAPPDFGLPKPAVIDPTLISFPMFPNSLLPIFPSPFPFSTSPLSTYHLYSSFFPNPSVDFISAFGEVKLVVDPRNPSCFVALKCIDLKKFQNNDDAMAQFKKEAYLQRLLSSKSCDNMIRYIGMRLETENGLRELQIYLEYADGGELFDQIEPDVGMPPVKAQFYFRQLLAGLEHIHGMGVVHRDIKPENLLLTGNVISMLFKSPLYKILIFSIYIYIYEKNFNYRAEPADIWSSGIVLVAMLAGELPWDSARQYVFYTKVLISFHDSVKSHFRDTELSNRNFLLSLLVKCPSFNDWMTSTNMDKNPWKKINNNALSLLRAVLNDNENTRATLQRIKDHPWTMADFNYTKENLPARKRKRLSSQKMEMPTVSQPLTPHSVLTESSCCNDITSFSQPENLDAMLINPSQIGVSQVNLLHPLTLLVRRMTRFCVTVSMTELIPRIYSACAEMGFVAVDKPPNMLERRWNRIQAYIYRAKIEVNGYYLYRRGSMDGKSWPNMFTKRYGRKLDTKKLSFLGHSNERSFHHWLTTMPLTLIISPPRGPFAVNAIFPVLGMSSFSGADENASWRGLKYPVNILRTIETGEFSAVHLIADPWKIGGRLALKCSSLNGCSSDEIARLHNEGAIHRMLTRNGSKYVIKCFAVQEDIDLKQLQLFLEYAENGSLFDMIEPGVGLDPICTQYYFKQLIDGLKYIHGLGIVHRDIKPENLLLMANGYFYFYYS